MAYWHEDGKQKAKLFKTESEALKCRAKMVELHYTHAPMRKDSCSSPTSPFQLVPPTFAQPPSSP